MGDQAGRVWAKALVTLGDELGPEEHGAWFAGTVGVGVEGTGLVVGVESDFFGDWLAGHYADEVLQAVRSAWPECSGVRYVVDARAVRPAESDGAASAGASTSEKSKRKPFVVECRLDKRYTFDRFVVGEGNRFAYSAMKAIAGGAGLNYNPVYLYGGTGVGKTHLMQALANGARSVRASLNIVYVSSEEFATDLIQSIVKRSTERFRTRYRKADILLVDDVQFLGGKEATQEEFFHLFNFLLEGRKRVIMSAERRPEDIGRLNDRLASRFASGLVVEVEGPDADTRRGILELRSAEEKMDVPEEVIEWLAGHARRNVRELEGALISLVAYCRLEHKPVTLATAREVLRDLDVADGVQGLTIQRVQEVVAEAYGVRRADLVESSRQRRYAVPRAIAMKLCRDLVRGCSLESIGTAFGGRDHTTVVYAVARAGGLVESSAEVRGMVSRIRRALGG